MKSRPPVDQDLLAVIGPEAIIEANRRLAMLDAVAYAATRMVAGDWRNHVGDFLKRLGRATEWAEVDGQALPFGQRVFDVDGEEVPILEIRKIEFMPAEQAVS